MVMQITVNPNYEQMDKRIVPLVKAINSLGIATYWSCEGHEAPSIISSFFPRVIVCFLNDNSHRQDFSSLFRALAIYNRRFPDESWIVLPADIGSMGAFSLRPNTQNYVSLRRRQAQARELVRIIQKIKKS